MKDTPKQPPKPNSPIKPIKNIMENLLPKDMKQEKDNLISFSFRNLIFEGQFTIENRKYVRYLYTGEKEDCFLDIFSSEFDEYFSLYKDLLEQAMEQGKECICDECIPEYDLIDEVGITKIITEEGEEVGEKQVSLKVYFIYDLVENLKVSIHEDEEQEDKSQLN